jgi:small subunit ribosomal protein S3
MTLTKVPKSYGESNIRAEYIVLWQETRVSFRRTMKKPKKTEMRGIKIQIARHLNGAEIACVEWARESRVSL